MSMYHFTVETINGETVSLSDYQGKVLLVVNTASKCGFTPQYEQLEALYQKYKDQGFAVLGFPCNQFLDQEPEENSKILEFCKLNYGVTFPLFAKIDVNGERAAPLFRYLQSEIGFQGFDDRHPLSGKLDEILAAEDPGYAQSHEIKWNFTKFLIDQQGNVSNRFEPTAPMEKVEEEIRRLLEQKESE